jgi:hypothetical protein
MNGPNLGFSRQRVFDARFVLHEHKRKSIFCVQHSSQENKETLAKVSFLLETVTL